MKTTADLLSHIRLEKIDDTTYKGVGEYIGTADVYGGQLFAQGLNAACRTVVLEKKLHSAHGLYLKAGRLNMEIIYKVHTIRDGNSFSMRRVEAYQEGELIFTQDASFHKEEESYNFFTPMPIPKRQAGECMSWDFIGENFGTFLPKRAKDFLQADRPVELKPVFIDNPMDSSKLPNHNDFWMKMKGDIPPCTFPERQQIIAYISDYFIPGVALQPHKGEGHVGNTITSTVSHTMWFTPVADIEEWMLYHLAARHAEGARGLTQGEIYSHTGKPMAYVSQEGLLRKRIKDIS